MKYFRVKAAVLTLRSCVFCSGSVGGFTFGQLSVRLPRNFTNIKHLAQGSFGVVWMTFLGVSASKEGETWRVWIRKESYRQYPYNPKTFNKCRIQ